jgi:mannose/fructose/N-acetylgalactosamine-specific phosphotransferase system component IIB
VSLVLARVDDRLIHGQVVVGWGKALGIRYIVLVDDKVRASEWEQDLYRMGVPPDVDVTFASAAEAGEQLAQWQADRRPGILLTANVETMAALCANGGPIRRVNVGGVHHRPGRSERLRYVYLTDAEAALLRDLAARGVEVTAQDVPTARPVPVGEFT